MTIERKKSKMELASESVPIKHLSSYSHTALELFNNCKKAYYWQYIRNLESTEFKKHLEMGKIVHDGIHVIYKKTGNPAELVKTRFEELREKLREDMVMTTKIEEELIEMELIALAMMEGYPIKYKDFIDEVDHIVNEKPFRYIFPSGLTVKGKMDNIFRYRGKYYIHELKTAKYINDDYITGIQIRPQLAIYRHLGNDSLKDFKISGVIFDVIQKPSIRQKQKETREEFLQRLMEYYSLTKLDEYFYMEVIEHPRYTKKMIANDVEKSIIDIRNCKTEDDFYRNPQACAVLYRCQFYDICWFGENAATMRNYKTRIDLTKKSK